MKQVTSFLDKFEEHFGSGWTRALLTLVGLALASVCGLIIWLVLLSPLVGTILRSGANRYGRVEEAATITAFLMIAAFGLGFGVRVAGKYIDWAIGAHLLEQMREAKRAVVDAEKRLAFTEAKLAASEHRAATAEAHIEDVFARALETKMLTRRDLEKLRRASEVEEPGS